MEGVVLVVVVGIIIHPIPKADFVRKKIHHAFVCHGLKRGWGMKK